MSKGQEMRVRNAHRNHGSEAHTAQRLLRLEQITGPRKSSCLKIRSIYGCKSKKSVMAPVAPEALALSGWNSLRLGEGLAHIMIGKGSRGSSRHAAAPPTHGTEYEYYYHSIAQYRLVDHTVAP